MTGQPAKASADPRYADIQYRWRELSACAAGIIPSRIPLEPAPTDIAIVVPQLQERAG